MFRGGAENRPESFNLGFELAECAVVGEDVVAAWRFKVIGDLQGETTARFGFKGLLLFRGGCAAWVLAVNKAGDLFGFGSGDEEHSVEAGGPVARASVSGLEDERGFDDQDGVGVVREDFLRKFSLSRDDRGMDDGVQFFGAVLGEGQAGEFRAIQGSWCGQDRGAKMPDDLVEDSLAGLHQLAADRIGGEGAGAKRGEESGHGGFATA